MESISRRRFLAQASAGLIGSAVLAACGQPAAPPTAAPATSATTKPATTAATAPTAAPTAAKATAPAPQASPAAATKPAATGAKPTTVRLAVRNDVSDDATLKSLLGEFQTKNPSLQVASSDLPPYDGFFEKMMTQVAAGTAPDAFMLLAYWGAVFGKRANVLLPLDEHLKGIKGYSKDAYDKSLLTYCEYKGKLHALPLNTNVQGIIYNRDHFDKAGVTGVPKAAAEAWTQEQFLEVCAKLKQAKTADYPYGIYTGAPQGRLLFVYQQGRGIVTTDLKQGDLANPDSVAAIELTQSLFQQKHTPVEAWTATGPLANTQELFKAGKVSMFHGGQWHVPWARDNVKFNWGATYLQKGKALTTVPGGDVYAAFAQTKVPAEAATLVEFLCNESSQKKWNIVTYRISSLNALNRPGAMEWPGYKPEMDLFVDHLKYASIPMLSEYYADGWAKTDSMLRARTAELASGTMAAKRWAEDVNKEIDKFIKEGD